jgi:hypothetical protein
MDRPDDSMAEGSASRRPLAQPRLIRSPRNIEQQRLILLRKARAFIIRGHEHPAELSINHALELGAPVTQVSSALADLEPTGACLTRRQALQRTAVLLAGGALIGKEAIRGYDGARSALAAQGARLTDFVTSSVPMGLFLTTPLATGNGSYTVAAVTAAGLAGASGPYTGDILAQGNVAYNAGQSWAGGTASTTVTRIAADGSHQSFTLPAAGSTEGASVTESVTSIALVGSTLYCLNTWLRIFEGSGKLPQAKAGRKLVRLTSQPTLEVVDLASGQLSARWIGPEVPGACRATLKVSADGSGLVVAADMPSASAQPTAYSLRFENDHLSLTSQSSAAALGALASQYYFWSGQAAPVVQVAHDGIHRYGPTLGEQAAAGLPVLIGNNRLTPGFQGLFSAAGASLISSGDGRVFAAAAGSTTPRLVTTLPGKTLSPPCLVYQGARLGSAFAPGAGITWLIDNREGVGGIWRLDSSGRPGTHELAGTYLSECQPDSTGRFVAAISSLERVLYLLDPAGRLAAFTVPAHVQLVRASGRN